MLKYIYCFIIFLLGFSPNLWAQQSLRWQQPIAFAAFSPDGKYILIAEENDAFFRLADANTFQEVRRFPRESGYYAIFADMGKKIVSFSYPQTLSVYEVENGKLLSQFKSEEPIKNIEFYGNTDNKLLLQHDSSLSIWNVDNGKMWFQTPKNAAILSVLQQPDLLLYVSEKPIQVHLWNTKKQHLTADFDKHRGQITAYALSPNEQMLATGSKDHTTIVWDWKNGKPITTLTAHATEVQRVVFSPDNTRLATADAQSINIWALPKGDLIATYPFLDAPTTALAFDSTQQHLAFATENGVIKYWNIPENKILKQINLPKKNVYEIWITNNVLKIDFGYGEIRFWDIETQTEQDAPPAFYDLAFPAHRVGNVRVQLTHQRRLIAYENNQIVWRNDTLKVPIHLLLLSPDGKRLLTVSADDKWQIIDMVSGKAIVSIEKNNIAITDLALHQSSQTLAVATKNNALALYDAQTLQWKKSLVLPAPAKKIAFHPTKPQIAVVAANRTLVIQNIDKDTLIFSSKYPFSSLESVGKNALFFADSGKLLIIGGTLAFASWQTETNKLLGVTANFKAFSRVVFNAKMGFYAIENDKNIKLWANNKMTTLAIGGVPLAFNDEGTKLYIADNQTIIQFNIQNNAIEKRFEGLKVKVETLALTANGKLLAGGDLDGNLVFWDTDNGKAFFATQAHQRQVTALLFSADGKFAWSAGVDGYVRFWNVLTQKEIKTVRVK